MFVIFAMVLMFSLRVGAEPVVLYDGRLTLELPRGLNGPVEPIKAGTDHAYSDEGKNLALGIQLYPHINQKSVESFAMSVNRALFNKYAGTFKVSKERAERIGGTTFWVVEGGYTYKGIGHHTLGVFWLKKNKGLLILYACTDQAYPKLKQEIFKSKASIRWKG